MCERCCSRQAGLAQVTVGTTDVFHCERRERVLLRDIFRFGTATCLLLGLYFWDQKLSSQVWWGSLTEFGQLLPPRVDPLLMPVLGIVIQVEPTFGAQT